MSKQYFDEKLKMIARGKMEFNKAKALTAEALLPFAMAALNVSAYAMNSASVN